MRWLATAMILLLSSCSSQPQTNFYQLPLTTVTGSINSNSTQTLYIEPVQVASYLNGRGLVLQVSDVELVMARQHLWAEALDHQLQRQLRSRLQMALPEYMAVMQPSADTIKVTVQLDRFHGQEDGYAIASGRFVVSSVNTTESFSIRVPLADDGYPALVSALAQCVQQLSEQIAQQLTSES